MTDPLRYPDTADETGADPGSTRRTSLRLKVTVIVVVVLVLVMVGLHLAGIRRMH